MVGCVYHQYDAAGDVDGDVPIGVPIDGTVVRVMTQWNTPQLPGFVGELQVAGRGIARGSSGGGPREYTLGQLAWHPTRD